MKRRDGFWDEFFVGMARYVATASKDPSTKCGCAIVDKDRRVLSVGYNGFPAGVEDTRTRYENRDLKYPLVAHAEINGICSAARIGVSLVGATSYQSVPSCSECMKAIIQAGIVRVVWPVDNPLEMNPAAKDRWATAFTFSKMMADEAGVELVRIDY